MGETELLDGETESLALALASGRKGDHPAVREESELRNTKGRAWAP